MLFIFVLGLQTPSITDHVRGSYLDLSGSSFSPVWYSGEMGLVTDKKVFVPRDSVHETERYSYDIKSGVYRVFLWDD